MMNTEYIGEEGVCEFLPTIMDETVRQLKAFYLILYVEDFSRSRLFCHRLESQKQPQISKDMARKANKGSND
jgi:hypothetical protein